MECRKKPYGVRESSEISGTGATVGLLSLAADGLEAALAKELEQLHARREPPGVDALTQLLAPCPSDVSGVGIKLPKLAVYDAWSEAVS